MYKFGNRSKRNLAGVHPKLVKVINDVMDLQLMDLSVIEGVRKKSRQRMLVANGKSRTMNSKHLVQKDGYGHATDVVPFPIDWQDTRPFYVMVGIIRAVAAINGVKVRVGADWDGDGSMKDQSFHDLPHIELVL